MPFEIEDLQYQYRWDENLNEDARPLCPDNVPLDRQDAVQVLGFIINYMNERRMNRMSTFHKLEWAMRFQVPATRRTCGQIRTWLNDNFDRMAV
jgi:hypothetical protein